IVKIPMDSKEVAHLALKIEKLRVQQSYGNIMDLLKDLDQAHIPAEQLETTDLVQVLYRLMKTSLDASVKKTVKGLLSKWRREYSKETQKQKKADLKRSEASDKCSPGEPAEPGSSVRSKCVELLFAALRPEPSDEKKAAELARDIEETLHALHSSKKVKYKVCVRSKVANLRNPNNGHLRLDLLSGSLTPVDFARMSSEEMACPELQMLRREYRSRGVSERQLPLTPEGTHTQKIRCRRCGGSECRVMQVSRGDAMTFVSCSGCGQQWYHSGWNCL
uniref:Transcription elongation factor A N-terminal and central domain containing n=1 Tax=Gouania willdenowi TaxID=441366 RepID=A0A8C5ET07_GOUWI